MIEGLLASVEGDELKRMCESCHEYHSQKHLAYEKEAVKLGEIEREFDEQASRIGKASNAPQSVSIRAKAEEHHRNAQFFRFMADHVEVGEIYQLTVAELGKLGIGQGY